MKRYHKNPRQITKKQFEQLKEWLAELGDLGGVVHDLNSDECIGGNQRVRALGLDGVGPVIVERFDPPTEQGTVALGYYEVGGERYGYRAVRWTPEQCEKANIVANKAGGGWDWDILANEWGIDNLLEWGFEAEELGIDLTPEPPADPGPQIDRAAELQEKWGVERGQVWEIPSLSVPGRCHRVMCGDSTSGEDVGRLFGADEPFLMVTDPPYGVEYDASWRDEAARAGLLQFGAARQGAVRHDDCVDWQAAIDLFPGSVIYCWHAGLHASEAAAFLKAAGFEIRCQIIWSKPHFVIGRGHYHTRHEPCWYAFRKGQSANWIGGRDQDTVWNITLDKNAEGGHSTQKPVECMARPIRNHKGDVYDPFLGSGTTIVACEQAARIGYGMEIESKYVAVTLERLAGMGLEPRLADLG